MSEQEKTDTEAQVNSTSTIWMRNGLLLIGIYVIIETVVMLNPLWSTVAELATAMMRNDNFLWGPIIMLLCVVAYLGLGVYLIRQSHVITADNFDDYETKTTWEPVAYKLIATLCGVLILASTLPLLGPVLSFIIMSIGEGNNKAILGIFAIATLFAVSIGIGIYLALGAPHLVKWRIKRPLKEEDPSLAEEDTAEDEELFVEDTVGQTEDEPLKSARTYTSVWLRNGLVILGVFSVVLAIRHSLPLVNLFLSQDFEEVFALKNIWPAFFYVATPGILFVIGFTLVRRSHVITAFTAGEDNHQVMQWEPAAYKLASVFAGILVLAYSLPKFGVYLIHMTTSYHTYIEDTPTSDFIVHIMPTIAWYFIQFSFAAYLLYGAPHLVRLHLVYDIDEDEESSTDRSDDPCTAGQDSQQDDD